MEKKKTLENSRMTILIAEDSPTQAEQLKSILEKHDYAVIYAKDGKEALAMISENKPSLVITDVIMPVMDGYQLCKEIKSNENTKDIPVILLTSLHNSEDVVEGIACGADNYLTKPYSETYLISHIEQIAANKKIFKNERIRTGVEILFGGKWRFITSDQQQMLTLLLSTYEAAVAKNKELMQTQEKLELLNEHLEELVEERTAELSAEIEIRKITEERVKKLNRMYATLSNINQTLVHVHEITPLFEKTCSIAIDVGRFQRAWIGIFDNEAGVIKNYSTAGLTNPYFDSTSGHLEEDDIIYKIIKTANHFIINNINTSTDMPDLWKQNSLVLGFQSVVAFPLIVMGEVKGGLCIYSEEVDFFDEAELNLLDEMALDISFALEYIQQETERKEGEEAVRASETRYRRLFEAAKDGILILDAQTGKIVDVNPFLIQLLGFSHEEFIGKPIWEIGSFRDTIASRDNFKELQQNEYVRYENLPLVCSDGRKIDAEFISNVYLVNKQKVIQCNIRDITERKLNEKRQALLASILSLINKQDDWGELVKDILIEIKEFTGFEAIGIRLKEGEDYPYFETNGFPIQFVEMEKYLCARDPNGKIMYTAEGIPYLECMCGNVIAGRTNPAQPFFTEKGSFWSNNTTELLATTSDKDHQPVTQNYCFESGYKSVALIPLHSVDGVIGLLQFNDKRTNRFTLDMIQFFEGIGTAIGIAYKRMQSEKAIIESEEKYRSVANSANDAIITSDINGKILSWNKGAELIFGYTGAEFLGKELAQIIPKEYVEKHVLGIKPAEQGGEHQVMGKTTELFGLRKNGTEFPLEISLAEWKTSSGKYYTGIIRDITERKRVEEEINLHLKELQDWFDVSVGRENRIIELKEEVNSLLKSSGKKEKYELE